MGSSHFPVAVLCNPGTTQLLLHTAATCLCSQEGDNRLYTLAGHPTLSQYQ